MEMKKFYDNQVQDKRLMKSQERQNDRELGMSIKDRVQTIDQLTDLDNTKRMLARGHLALENQTQAHTMKH